MKTTYRSNEKTIIVTFDDDSCEVVDCATLADVTDEEINAACSANGASIDGWECEVSW